VKNLGSLKLDKEDYYESIYRAAKNNDRETFRKLFLRLHDRDQNEVFHLLYPEKKRKIADFLLPEEFAEMFEWMAVEDQEAAVGYLPDEYMSKIFNYLANDDLVYFLTRSEDVDQEAIFGLLKPEERENVSELLSYADETAGSIMTKEFISVYDKQTAGSVINELRSIGTNAETIYYIYVIDETGNLVGVMSLRDLLLSPIDTSINDIMNTQLVSVQVNQDQEEVADVMKDYDLIAIPVLSLDGRMQGIITVDDVIDILKEERDEDFTEFAGIRTIDEKTPSFLKSALNRAPWLVLFMFLGLLTGGIMGLFEGTLQRVVLLSAFVPMVMNTAGSVGTQSLAVSLKNSDKEDKLNKSYLLKLVKKEFKAGLYMGIVAAIVLFLIVVILYGDLAIAGVVSLSILITISFSTIFGALIPILISKFNIDPSVASGPFVTTLNDGLALFLYLSIATLLLL